MTSTRPSGSPRPYRGLFVTFEGGEHTGKSTQAERVQQRLDTRGYHVLATREPGGTLLGEALRGALFDLDTAPSALAELLTFEAARAELVATVIRPALERGEVVLCDRFTDSTVAYQGFGRGLPRETVEAVNAAATGGLVPDVTILLDMDPASARQRSKRAQGEDYLEREAVAFHERVREGFLALAREEPQRVTLFNGDRDRDELTEAIWTRILAALDKERS